MVDGTLNASYFRGPTDTTPLPTFVLTTENDAIPFTSVSLLAEHPTAAQRGLYKVFSREALGEAHLNALFQQRVRTARHEWAAYPHMRPVEPLGGAPPLVLADGIVYPSAFESAISTMETSMLAASAVVQHLLQDPAA